MRLWKLTPIDPSHRDWQASAHKGECIVYATDEDTARRQAALQFVKVVGREPDGYIPSDPWGQGELVSCTELEGFSGEEVPKVSS